VDMRCITGPSFVFAAEHMLIASTPNPPGIPLMVARSTAGLAGLIVARR